MPKDMTTFRHPLDLRITHKYQSGWSHLDKWTTVGTFDVLNRYKPVRDEDASDASDAGSTVLMLNVQPEPDIDTETVRQAIRDTFGGSTCTHEYDCCGCVSNYVADLARIDDTRWFVQIRHLRNY